MPHTLQKALAIARSAYPHTLDAPDSLWQNPIPVECEGREGLAGQSTRRRPPVSDANPTAFEVEILRCRSRAEALAFLRDNAVPVLICEADLIDGTWRDLLDETTCMRARPPAHRDLPLGG